MNQYIGLDLAWGEGTAARLANETGYAVFDKNGIISDAGWLRGLDAVVEWVVATARPGAIIAIDAPLVVINPTGMRECEREVGQRYGRWKVAANASNTAKSDLAGVRLRERLELAGFVYTDGTTPPAPGAISMFECYPYTAIVGTPEFGYDERPRYKRTIKSLTPPQRRESRAAACDGLINRMHEIAPRIVPINLLSHPAVASLVEEPSPVNDAAYKHREDLLDAVICAWTAAVWFEHGELRVQVLGRDSTPDAAGRRATIVAPARPEQRGDSVSALTASAPVTAITRTAPESRSHVFVCQGDLINLACDAYLVPTDRMMVVEPYWKVPELEEEISAARSDAFERDEVYAVTPNRDRGGRPTPVFTAVPFEGADGDLQQFGIRLDAFLREAARAIPAPMQLGRPNRLFAIPLFGTRGGGSGRRRGEVLDILLETARKTGAEIGVDVALVLRDQKTFARAGAKRRAAVESWWPELTEEELEVASSLAEKAKAGRLVPFLGAGISVSAGAPSWSSLLRQLGQTVGLSVQEIDQLSTRDPLDQAAYLQALHSELHPNDPDSFNKAVAQIVQRPRYGLAPLLVAGLGSEQAITLNYDELYETASADGGRPLRVIAGEPTNSTSTNWLLKLHGTVSSPKTIVLTREDYLGFNSNRQALSALVKATLITHHLLFVGFGLRDDHFHEIVHDVSRAVGTGASREGLATALTLFHDPLDARLWSGKLELVSMMAPDREADAGLAARKLEVFLDAVLTLATDSHGYLLDEYFRGALDEADAALAEALGRFITTLAADAKASASWQRVAALLGELGSK